MLLSIVDDPVYLDEPFVRTSTFAWAPNQVTPSPVPFEIVDEVEARPTGWVPSFPMGTRHDEFAKRFGLPFEATRGGAQTMYPEYMRTLRTGTAAATAAPVPADPARAVPPGGGRPAGEALEVLPVQGRVHLIVADGANVVVQAGEQRAFVVDAGNGVGTDRILTAIGRLAPAPIRYLVNTSADPDHLAATRPPSSTAACRASGPRRSPRRTSRQSIPARNRRRRSPW